MPGTNLVRCSICGEIFDGSIDVCPACGVGRNFFEPYNAIQQEEKKPGTALKYLIAGGGAAAFYAASSAREQDMSGEITILSDESYLPYHRPMLTKGKYENIEIKKQNWYKNNGINIIINTAVQSIDIQNNRVIDASGTFYSYDRLIYALGAECFVPPIKGADGKNIFTIRRIGDALKIKGISSKIKTAAVIGGGVLGLEISWLLKTNGLDITVLESAPGLLSSRISAYESQSLKELVESCGVNVITGAATEFITDFDEKKKICLAGGGSIICDIIIISTGIKPNTEIAKAAGIKTNRAVAVDKYMRTNIENIYSCGDCAELDGINYALWREASEMGKAAGINAAGGNIEYQNIKPPMVINAFGKTLIY